MKIALVLLPFVSLAAVVITGVYAAKLHSNGLGVLCFFLFIVTLARVNNLVELSKKNQQRDTP